MAANFNKTILAGNLTKDPEVKYTSSGTAVCSISLAINRQYNGQKKTTYVECTLFGKAAENAAKYLQKGSSVLIEGRLHQEQWQDKNSGKSRSKLVVIADSVQFLSSPKNQQQQYQY